MNYKNNFILYLIILITMFSTVLLWIFIIILFLSAVNYGLMGFNSDWNLIERISNMVLKKIIYFTIFVVSILVLIILSMKKFV